MRASLLLVPGICLALAGCFLPTPLSIVSSGFDAVSFVATGKTVTDHGVSLAMGEDCALSRVLDGKICQETVDYEPVEATATLQPLPAANSPLLAEAHPEVQAAAQRVAAHEGWTEDAAPATFGAAVFVADGIRPDATIEPQPILIAEAPVLTAPVTAQRAPEQPLRSPLAGATFLADASFTPDGWSPRSAPVGDPIIIAAVPEKAVAPRDDLARLNSLAESFEAVSRPRARTAQAGILRRDDTPPRFRARNNREVGVPPQVASFGQIGAPQVVLGTAEERFARGRRGTELDG